MICNRCGTQNNDYNQVCIRCGNQLIQNKQIMNNNQSIYNNMNNNLPEKKINNFKKIVYI